MLSLWPRRMAKEMFFKSATLDVILLDHERYFGRLFGVKSNAQSWVNAAMLLMKLEPLGFYSDMVSARKIGR